MFGNIPFTPQGFQQWAAGQWGPFGVQGGGRKLGVGWLLFSPQQFGLPSWFGNPWGMAAELWKRQKEMERFMQEQFAQGLASVLALKEKAGIGADELMDALREALKEAGVDDESINRLMAGELATAQRQYQLAEEKLREKYGALGDYTGGGYLAAQRRLAAEKAGTVAGIKRKWDEFKLKAKPTILSQYASAFESLLRPLMGATQMELETRQVRPLLPDLSAFFRGFGGI